MTVDKLTLAPPSSSRTGSLDEVLLLTLRTVDIGPIDTALSFPAMVAVATSE
jgi:hypothetical protein